MSERVRKNVIRDFLEFLIITHDPSRISSQSKATSKELKIRSTKNAVLKQQETKKKKRTIKKIKKRVGRRPQRKCE